MNRRQMKTGTMLVVAVLVAWAIWTYMRNRSIMKYRPIVTDMGDSSPDIFANQAALRCVPGPGPDAAYYTDSTGGGLCGDQPYVHRFGHEYNITDGVGGGLLSM